MAVFPIILVLVALLLVIGVVMVFKVNKISEAENRRTGKKPKGHYLNLGIAMGIAIGIPIGIAMDMIAIGPGLGMAIGIAIGAALEKQHEKELRPLTKKEEEMRVKVVYLMGGLLVLGLAVFLALILLGTNL